MTEPLQDLLAQRYGQSASEHPDAELNQTLRNILTRRSARSFREDPVPPELLHTLFATAFSAPSKSDLQQACVINVSDADEKGRSFRLMAIVGGVLVIVALALGYFGIFK